jgi:hypothetical protein
MNLLELNDEKVTIGSNVTVRDLDTGEVEVGGLHARAPCTG